MIPQSIASGSPVEWDSAVRLRHLVSGQYLALRPEHPKDSICIRASSRCLHKSAGSSRHIAHGIVSSPLAGMQSPAASIVGPSASEMYAEIPETHGEPQLRMVVATVSDPLDPATLFRVRLVFIYIYIYIYMGYVCTGCL